MHNCDCYKKNRESCKRELIHHGRLDHPIDNNQDSLDRSTTPESRTQSGNLLPSIRKITQPTMRDRYLQPNLVTAFGHFSRYQTNTSTDPLDVLLPIKRRQYQVSQPIRHIVGQLRAQHINPIRHKPAQGKMIHKFITKLTNPSFRRPSLIMNLHQLLDFSLPVGHDSIVLTGGRKGLISQCPLRKKIDTQKMEEEELWRN